MKNLLNIDEQVKINTPGVFGDGETVKVTQIDVFNGELYYTGAYYQNCPDGGEGYDNTIQFKEGQYQKLDKNEKSSSVGNLSIQIGLDGIDDVKNQLDNLESQLDRIVEKINQVKFYN